MKLQILFLDRYYYFEFVAPDLPIIFLNCVKNTMVVTVAAIISLTGSAKNTANTLSSKKFGKMKINGISKIILRKNARNKLIFA